MFLDKFYSSFGVGVITILPEGGVEKPPPSLNRVKFNDASVLFYFSSSSFLIFFIVPSESVLTEFHCLIKSNICQTVIQTSCESRTVSWKLTTKTDCDVQELRCCHYSVDSIFCTLTLIPELMVEENCLSQQQCNLMMVR